MHTLLEECEAAMDIMLLAGVEVPSWVLDVIIETS